MSVQFHSLVKHFVLIAAVGVLLTSPSFAPHAQAEHSSEARIGLEGYCPVCIVAAKKWEKGRPDIKSTYDGVTYLFPNAEIKAKFDKNPSAFVPALGGDCTVCYAKMGKRVPGNIRHAALHNNRLFLFPSDKEKQIFLKDSKSFENTDLAAHGQCVVCLKKANKQVPGKAEFTEIYHGLRYLFPSAGEKDEFRRSPAKYAASIDRDSKKMSTLKQSSSVHNANLVSVSGTSACAGCEHGVTPLGSPDELGLAINTKNGRVVVVEDAHKNYPNIYASRFEGQTLQVRGTVLKTDGKISWVKPVDLRVVNRG